MVGKILPLLLICAAFSSAWAASEAEYRTRPVKDIYGARRERMVQEIESDVRATRAWIGTAQLSPRVMAVMAKVPRHKFVPRAMEAYAYDNRPLPIGYGQTISQPYIVSLMTDLLEIKPNDTVLEVGTGSGYQAAILSELVKEVYTIEIIPELGERAKKRLNQLAYNNVHVRIADGYYGWKEHSPFSAIIVTAAASQIPPPLIRQLAKGGRMVIPVGGPFSPQHLMLVTKDAKGVIRTRQVLPVRFVPLTGNH